MKHLKVKKKKQYARCSSCKTEKYQTEIKIAIASMQKVDRIQFSNHRELDRETYNSFIDSDFEWACDECLNTKKAILSTPNLQNYCWYPHYSYSDSELVCRTCNTKFIFSKNEKKFWYEELKFWVDAEPINCIPCRKEIRTLKLENITLSAILRKEESEISLSELEQVIRIYTKWGKEEKLKYYQAVLRKRRS